MRAARWAWGAWWVGGLAVPLGQLQTASVEDSGWILWACWAAAAGWLGLWTPRQREVSTAWLAWVVAAWLVHPLLVSWPQLTRSAWVESWGLVAHLSASGCFALLLAWGSCSVLTHSPNVVRHVAGWLSAFLLLNAVSYVLQHSGVYSRWHWNEWEDLGGLFSSKTVWSAWCIIALPFLLRQRGGWQLLSLPALYGVVVSQRTTVFLALIAWVAWELWPYRRVAVWWSVAALLLIVSAWLWRVQPLAGMWVDAQPRLATWPVVLAAILQHPLGIGSHPLAYHELVARAPWPIMGHPSSSLLSWVLSGGWAMGAAVAVCGAWWWSRLQRDALSASLVVCGVLLLIQRTLAQAQVGALAWALGCLWLIGYQEREHHARNPWGAVHNGRFGLAGQPGVGRPAAARVLYKP